MRTRRARVEDQIQKAVFQHLRERGAPGSFAFHPANGGYRKPIEAAVMKGLGVRAGVPDVIVVKDGRTYALELKAPDGRVTEVQAGTAVEMRCAGAIVGVAYGLDDALHWLEKQGLLIGTAVLNTKRTAEPCETM